MQDEETQKRVALGTGHCSEDSLVLANVLTLLLPETQGDNEMVVEKLLALRPTTDKIVKEASMASRDFLGSIRISLHVGDCKSDNLAYDWHANSFSQGSSQQRLY
jgi:hypothetical protein